MQNTGKKKIYIWSGVTLGLLVLLNIGIFFFQHQSNSPRYWDNVISGMVVDIDENALKILDTHGVQNTVYFSPQTKVISGRTELQPEAIKVGGRVLINTEINGSKTIALEVRLVTTKAKVLEKFDSRSQ